ncbi:MAG: PDZ domain-containing protein [Pirellulales bacterium]
MLRAVPLAAGGRHDLPTVRRNVSRGPRGGWRSVLAAGCLWVLPWAQAQLTQAQVARAEDPAPPAEKTDDIRRWLERVGGVRTANPFQRDHATVRTAFVEVVATSRSSTVRILGDEGQLALGTVVAADGWILTKASELRGSLTCALTDGRKLPAEITGVSEEYDLALLHVAAQDLTPVRWSDHVPAVGSWLATPNQDRLPAAIGVVSNEPRPIPAPLGFLGVGLDDRRSEIIHVYSGMAADKAGLRVHDVVLSVAGRDVKTREQLQAEVRRRQPGQSVELLVQRGREQLKIQVVLGDAPTAATNERIEFQNRLGGQLSQRRAGFPQALQHDTVLRPNECGGPLVDLDGRVVAINIARAGRVASYAVPASVVVPLIAELKSRKLTPEQVAGSAESGDATTMPTSVTRP